MTNSFYDNLYSEYKNSLGCPKPKEVINFYTSLIALLFPELLLSKISSPQQLNEIGKSIEDQLITILEQNKCDQVTNTDRFRNDFFNSIEDLKHALELDVDAIFKGDPAAKSKSEVIRTYPGFKAIAAHRIAHKFQIAGMTLIARIISEHAHSITGIDIHPGATIGQRFCIDHGTGVVIGETTIIGNDVKIYQGVTLGALSVNKEDAKTKRHPTIEDNVVIYSGATILGGKTIIGQNSIIGGNVWITESVPANSKLTYVEQQKNNQKIEKI